MGGHLAAPLPPGGDYRQSLSRPMPGCKGFDGTKEKCLSSSACFGRFLLCRVRLRPPLSTRGPELGYGRPGFWGPCCCPSCLELSMPPCGGHTSCGVSHLPPRLACRPARRRRPPALTAW